MSQQLLDAEAKLKEEATNAERMAKHMEELELEAEESKRSKFKASCFKRVDPLQDTCAVGGVQQVQEGFVEKGGSHVRGGCATNSRRFC